MIHQDREDDASPLNPQRDKKLNIHLYFHTFIGLKYVSLSFSQSIKLYKSTNKSNKLLS